MDDPDSDDHVYHAVEHTEIIEDKFLTFDPAE